MNITDNINTVTVSLFQYNVSCRIENTLLCSQKKIGENVYKSEIELEEKTKIYVKKKVNCLSFVSDNKCI